MGGQAKKKQKKFLQRVTGKQEAIQDNELWFGNENTQVWNPFTSYVSPCLERARCWVWSPAPDTLKKSHVAKHTLAKALPCLRPEVSAVYIPGKERLPCCPRGVLTLNEITEVVLWSFSESSRPGQCHTPPNEMEMATGKPHSGTFSGRISLNVKTFIWFSNPHSSLPVLSSSDTTQCHLVRGKWVSYCFLPASIFSTPRQAPYGQNLTFILYHMS